MRISDWSSDVCSSDLGVPRLDAEFRKAGKHFLQRDPKFAAGEVHADTGMDAKAKCGMPGLAVQPDLIGRFEFLGIAIDQRCHHGDLLTRFHLDPLARHIARAGSEYRHWKNGVASCRERLDKNV